MEEQRLLMRLIPVGPDSAADEVGGLVDDWLVSWVSERSEKNHMILTLKILSVDT